MSEDQEEEEQLEKPSGDCGYWCDCFDCRMRRLPFRRQPSFNEPPEYFED